MKQSLQEEPAEVKELKMKEIRAIMRINWHVEIETCELLEKTIGELCSDIFKICPGTTEEKQFVNNTIKTIEDCLKRECTVPKFQL